MIMLGVEKTSNGLVTVTGMKKHISGFRNNDLVELNQITWKHTKLESTEGWESLDFLHIFLERLAA